MATFVWRPTVATADAWPTGAGTGAWTYTGTQSNFDVAATGPATQVLPNGSTQRGILAVRNTDSIMDAVLYLPALGAGTIQFVLSFRAASDFLTRYSWLVEISSAGALTARIRKQSSNLVSAASGTYTPPGLLRVCGVARGPSLKMWLWPDGTSRPAAPNVSTTDASYTSGTHVGVEAFTNAAGSPVAAWREVILRNATRPIDARRPGVVRV